MRRGYDYGRKRPFAGHHAEAKRDFRRNMTMLLVGALVIGILLYFILVQ